MTRVMTFYQKPKRLSKPVKARLNLCVMHPFFACEGLRSTCDIERTFVPYGVLLLDVRVRFGGVLVLALGVQHVDARGRLYSCNEHSAVNIPPTQHLQAMRVV
eukprot:3166440-Prymnesium_polylepis.1